MGFALTLVSLIVIGYALYIVVRLLLPAGGSSRQRGTAPLGATRAYTAGTLAPRAGAYSYAVSAADDEDKPWWDDAEDADDADVDWWDQKDESGVTNGEYVMMYDLMCQWERERREDGDGPCW